MVSDVGRYTEFVPFCSLSKVIRRRDQNNFDASVGLGYMGISDTWLSRVQLVANRSVIGDAIDARLFSLLRSAWSFEDSNERLECGETGCILHFQLDMRLKSLVQDQLLGKVCDAQ